MATFWSRISMATTAAYYAFVRTYTSPESAHLTQAAKDRQTRYAYLWSYYNNSAFEDLASWNTYKSKYRLYRFTREIYNPAKRVANFYAGTVYPGRLSTERDQSSAIPLNEQTPDPLRAAIAQIYQWGNWQAGKGVMVRRGSILGEGLIEIVDDTERGLVYPQNVWPGFVTELSTDSTGNVKSYTLEYDAADDKPYRYKKTVDVDAIRQYRDNQLVDETPNPYTFVPACWVVHCDEGDQNGAPAIRNLGKWDELNSLAAHANDQMHKQLAAPVLMAGTNISAWNPSNRTATSDDAPDKQQELTALRGSADATVQSMSLEGLDTIIPHIEKLIAEIEADHPELSMYTQLRSMSQMTGPAASRMLGDVQALVADAAANYDLQTIKMLQMSVAIAGWRLSTGAWGGTLTRQQQAFAGFDLDSYKAGDLDFSIDDRPLIPLTEQEQIELERQQIGLETDKKNLAGMNQAGSIADRLRAAA